MEFIHTPNAPEALGPYSQAIKVDGWLYTSGQIGIDPKTGEMACGFEAQAVQVLKNLAAVLEEAGCSFQDVVKTTIYVTYMGDFALLNKLYGKAMGDHRPARSTVQAATLPIGALVEIDFVARIPTKADS